MVATGRARCTVVNAGGRSACLLPLVLGWAARRTRSTRPVPGAPPASRKSSRGLRAGRQRWRLRHPAAGRIGRSKSLGAYAFWVLLSAQCGVGRDGVVPSSGAWWSWSDA